MASTGNLVGDSVNDIPGKLTIDEEHTKTKTFKSMSNTERLSYIKELITVEPMIGAYLIASIVLVPALFNLEFEKACRVNLQYNDTVCDTILYTDDRNFSKQNDEIQVKISNMHSWQLPLQSVMPLILVLFLGSYSDRHKLRKPFLILPIIGEFFSVGGCILCVIFMRQWPLEVQGIFQTVIPSFFGGQTMIVMAVFAYIADVSTLEMRTLRVGVVQIVLNACVPMTQAFSGVLFEKVGYIGVLVFAAVFHLFALIYGIFWIKEPKQPDIVMSKTSFLKDAFDPRQVVETFNILFKKKQGNNRAFILLVLFIFFVYSVVNVGENSVFYLYVQRVFSWTPLTFSYYITVNTIIHLIGTAIGVPLFTNFFKMTDLMIMVITFLDKMLANIVFGLARTTAMLYVASAVSIITGLSPIALRSLGTKIVADDDLGKAQSLFGVCEALGPALGGPVYNTLIYVNTLQTFPEAYFYFGIILYGLCIAVFLWMYFRIRGKTKSSNGIQQTPNNEIYGNSGKGGEEYHVTHM